MNKTHDERHEALLQALLTRDRSRTDPDIARLLAECAQCREQLAGLESVVDSVSALAAERDAVFATPRSATQAALEPRVRATLERLRDEAAVRPAPTPVRSTHRWLWPAVAAAILVAAFFIARESRPKPRPDDQTLGTKPELVSPGAFFGPSDVFECRFDGPASYGFEFRVEDMSGKLILAPRELRTTMEPERRRSSHDPRSLPVVGSCLRRIRIVAAGRRLGQALIVALALICIARGQSAPDDSDGIKRLAAAYENAEGNPDEFEAALKVARDDAEHADARSRPRLKARVERLESLGLINMQEWERARLACESAIESSKAIGAEDFGAVTDLAEVELHLQQPLRALELLRRTIDNGYEQKADKDAAISWNGIAFEVYVACGLYDLAFARLKALERLAAGGNLENRVELAFRRVNLEARTEQFDSALTHANEMLAWPKVSDRDRNEMLVRLGLIQSETARGRRNDGGATRTLEEALDFKDLNSADALHAESILLDLALRAGDFDLARRRLKALDDRFALLAKDASNSTQPFRRCVRSAYAARLALDSGAAPNELRERRDELARGIESVWRIWEERIGRAGGIGFLALGTQRMIVSEAMRLEIALDPTEHGIENALTILLRAQRPGTLSRRLGQTELTLADVRAAGCHDETTVLVILPAMDRSHVFQLDARTVDHFETGSRDELLAAVRDLGAITDHPPPHQVDVEKRRGDFDRAVEVLTGLMFDAEGRACSRRWKRLTVIGAQLVSNVPIEFLRPIPGHEVGLEVPIAYVSSMPLLVALEQRAQHRSPTAFPFDLVLVGDPAVSGHTDSPKLDLTDDERASLRRGFSLERVLELYDSDATLEAAISDRVAKSAVVAFFAHGRLDSTDEMPATVELTFVEGRPSSLNSTVVAGMAHTPRFVELFSCRVGNGPLRMGDDAATNLGAAYLAVGTDAVLTSLRDLSVRGSLNVAHELHPAIAAGATPAEALRRARVALAKSPETADPYFRSFLRIEGLGHRAVFPGGTTTAMAPASEPVSRRTAVLAGAAIVIGAALSLLVQKRRKNAA